MRLDMAHVYKSLDMARVYKSLDMARVYKSLDMAHVYKSLGMAHVYKSLDMAHVYKSLDMAHVTCVMPLIVLRAGAYRVQVLSQYAHWDIPVIGQVGRLMPSKLCMVKLQFNQLTCYQQANQTATEGARFAGMLCSLFPFQPPATSAAPATPSAVCFKHQQNPTLKFFARCNPALCFKAGYLLQLTTCTNGAETLRDDDAAAVAAAAAAAAAAQAYILFRAKLASPFTFSSGPESLEVALFDPAAIPFDQIAFSSVSITLQHYLQVRRCCSNNKRAVTRRCCRVYYICLGLVT
jgi:hypothetical protein